VPFPAAGSHQLGAYVALDLGDPRAVVPILADKIDPNTNDFADLLSSATVLDGMLQEAYSVERNSGPAVETVGHTFREVRNTDPSAVGEFKARSRVPVQELEAAGMLTLVSATPTIDEDTVELDIVVRDLTAPSGGPKSKNIPLDKARSDDGT
jgi:hypothetical protein